MKERFILAGMMQMLVVCACPATAPDLLRTNDVPVRDEISLVAFSPDGSLLGSGGYNGSAPAFRVWRTEDLAPVWNDYAELREGWLPTSISFSADNTIVGFGCSKGRPGQVVQVRPVLPVLNISTYDSGPYVANVLAISPVNSNPRVLLNAGPAGAEKRSVFYAETNVSWISAPTAFLGSAHPGWPSTYPPPTVTCLTVSPDGTTFLMGNDSGTVQRWQVEPPQLLWQTNFANHRVSAINVLSNGPPIVTLLSNTVIVGGEYHLQDVRLWQVGATNWLQTVRPDLAVFSTALTPDAKFLFTVLAVSHNIPPYNPTFYTNHVVLWRVSDGRMLVRYNEDLPEVQQVAVAPDGKTFAYGRGDGIVAIVRMPTLVTKAEIRTNQFNFEWQGGSGLYQVQQATSVTAAIWANIGSATTATNLAVPMTNPAVFFRVQSVTNAP